MFVGRWAALYCCGALSPSRAHRTAVHAARMRRTDRARQCSASTERQAVAERAHACVALQPGWARPDRRCARGFRPGRGWRGRRRCPATPRGPVSAARSGWAICRASVRASAACALTAASSAGADQSPASRSTRQERGQSGARAIRRRGAAAAASSGTSGRSATMKAAPSIRSTSVLARSLRSGRAWRNRKRRSGVQLRVELGPAGEVVAASP